MSWRRAMAAHLRRLLDNATGSGDQGGFRSPGSTEKSIALLAEAVSELQLDSVGIGIDMAGNASWDASRGIYSLSSTTTAEEMASVYTEWCSRWPITFIEDPFDDDDVAAWKLLMLEIDKLDHVVLLVGDDLLATDIDRLAAVDGPKSVSAAIAKVDQCGSVTQTAEFVRKTSTDGIQTVMSHRSRETDSSLLADLAVGLGTDWMKGGSCSRERIIKYNRLGRIVDDHSILPRWSPP